MAIVYLGIGSNMGERRRFIDQAFSLLAKEGVEVLLRSSLIETDPVGGLPQGRFLNGVVKARTDWPPEELLKRLKAIERRLGRKPTVRNGPRPIDLDILLYDDLTIRLPHLVIPHPRMHERAFVLIPLYEIRQKEAV